jgi:acetyl esterase/lipase
MTQTIVYNPERQYAVQVIDTTYRKDDSGALPARIYRPEGEGPFPLLLDVHGGAWSAGGCTDNQILDMALAESGLVVVAVELRKAPACPYPSQVMDVNFATRWAKAHAGKFNAVPEGMGGLGTSSGGHTLFLSAMRPMDARYGGLDLPDAEGVDARLSYVIGAWPVIDPYARYLYAKENNRDFLVQASEAYFGNTEAMKEGNPLLALERDDPIDLPAALMIQGTEDANLPLASADQFVNAYRNANGVAEIEWFADMPHNFALKAGAGTDRAIKVMKAFIAGRLDIL